MGIRYSILAASLLLAISAATGCSSSGSTETKAAENQAAEKAAEEKDVYEWIMFDYMTSESTVPKLEKVWAEDVLEKPAAV